MLRPGIDAEKGQLVTLAERIFLTESGQFRAVFPRDAEKRSSYTALEILAVVVNVDAERAHRDRVAQRVIPLKRTQQVAESALVLPAELRHAEFLLCVRNDPVTPRREPRSPGLFQIPLGLLDDALRPLSRMHTPDNAVARADVLQFEHDFLHHHAVVRPFDADKLLLLKCFRRRVKSVAHGCVFVIVFRDVFFLDIQQNAPRRASRRQQMCAFLVFIEQPVYQNVPFIHALISLPNRRICILYFCLSTSRVRSAIGMMSATLSGGVQIMA